MSDNNEYTQLSDGNLTPNEMSNIYTKLSTSVNTDLDFLDEKAFVDNCIEECFDSKFKSIDTQVLQSDAQLLNIEFCKLIRFCRDKSFYKCGVLFIEFVDYFDLDYNKTFLALHDKLQQLIKKACQCLIGQKEYSKHKLKESGGLHIPSLFDYMNKK